MAGILTATAALPSPAADTVYPFSSKEEANSANPENIGPRKFIRMVVS